MADPEADGRDVYEAQKAFVDFIVTSGNSAGAFELVEAPIDEVAQPVEPSANCNTKPAGLARRDYWHNVACLHGFANLVRFIATISKQSPGFRQVIVHDKVDAQIVRRPPGVMSDLMGRPAPLTRRWTLVVKPPLEPPKPCRGVPL